MIIRNAICWSFQKKNKAPFQVVVLHHKTSHAWPIETIAREEHAYAFDWTGRKQKVFQHMMQHFPLQLHFPRCFEFVRFLPTTTVPLNLVHVRFNHTTQTARNRVEIRHTKKMRIGSAFTTSFVWRLIYMLIFCSSLFRMGLHERIRSWRRSEGPTVCGDGWGNGSKYRTYATTGPDDVSFNTERL